MSPAFLDFRKQALLGIPHLLWLAILIAAAMAVFLNVTCTGRVIYAVGGNPT